MGRKLDKNTYPNGSSPNDFQCFGPPAVEDGQFDTVKICDMGSFSQDEKDSNKYYHAAIVQHKQTKKYYVYFEWGRVGASKPSFQFVECQSEADAQQEFASQCHEKNDKRGVWATVAGVKTLTAKPGKDVYLVRQLATRSTGLPDAKTIKCNEGAKAKPAADRPDGKKKAPSKAKADPYTTRLLTDLMGGTISYTRGSMADSSIPTQGAIDMGRNILQEATKRLLVVGNDLDTQIQDRDLRTLSGELYRRIPKKKRVGTPDADWILSQNNILSWQSDLDAFEAALNSQDFEQEPESDPFQGLPLHMEWIDPKSDVGKFLYYWWPKATANRHGGIGDLKIKNLWKVERHGDEAKVLSCQDKVITELGKNKIKDRALFQPSERHDVGDLKNLYQNSNTALLFHGTRSVNVTGILREALRLPKQLVGVVITGAMFGPGLYFADDWKKSAGYTSMRNSYWSRGGGTVAGREAFMFAVDVVLGQPHYAPRSHGYTTPPKDHHCIYARGSNTDARNNSGVQNNEWIVFQSAQHRLRYLAEFSA
jgi:hypothetical protein